MKTTLFGMGLGLAIVSVCVAASQAKANPVSGSSNPPFTTQSVAQNTSSQAAQTRILDLGVSQSQLQQMKAVGMRMVMPTTVPAGFRLTTVASRSDSRFGPSYLLVYRKGSACFGIEGTRGGIGGIPTGDAGSYPIKNAVLGRGQLEYRRSAAEQPQLISQWLGRDPFYRFVGANYQFNGDSELSGCQEISVKDAILVSESLRYLDLDQNIVEGLPASGVPVTDANSPTSTVVRYPTQQEFNSFKRDLQAGTFGTGTKMTSEELRQRQAYLVTWDKVNSTGAKFAGAWSDGNRYYYIYPSKIKSRVCIVTLIDGKYDFSNGQAISQELRYRNHGFFLVDQPGVLAARNNGTGKLYPVFAVQSVPDANAIANFDFGFRHAECTTELPGIGQNVGGGTR